jgi:hypothetical protein
LCYWRSVADNDKCLAQFDAVDHLEEASFGYRDADTNPIQVPTLWTVYIATIPSRTSLSTGYNHGHGFDLRRKYV